VLRYLLELGVTKYLVGPHHPPHRGDLTNKQHFKNNLKKNLQQFKRLYINLVLDSI
jgi:hypothetical protein